MSDTTPQDETRTEGEQSDEPTAEDAWDDDSPVENEDMTMAGRVALVIKMMVIAPATWLLKWVPKSDGLADMLIMAGMKQKIKLNRKADSVAFVIYGDGQVVPRAAQWQSADRQYVTDNGEEISADGEGHRPYLMGKTPVTFALRSAPETFDPVLAFFAKKAELGEWVKTATPDGGTDVLTTSSMPRSKDGLILSWEKAWELFAQKISREDLKEQYRMGYLDGLEGPGRNQAFMYLLVFGAGIVATLGILWVASNFLGGGGGGGGGSIVPLMLGVF